MNRKLSYFFVLTFVLASCSTGDEEMNDPNNNPPVNTGYDWTVSKNDLTGSDDPFPFAENPLLSPVSEVIGLTDDDTVVLVSFDSEIRVYPYKFIAPFEVVNDQMDGESYAITYCPVTESSHCADNSFNDTPFSLIASGFRYKANLISLDSSTGTYWSQMLMKCVKGQFQNQFQQTLPMVETNWNTVKTYFADALVFTPGSIAEKDSTSSNKPVNSVSPGKDERVFGVLEISDIEDTKVKVFRRSDFNDDINLYTQIISSENTVVIGSTSPPFMVAYIDEHGVNYTPIQHEYPVVMMDNSGSKWSVFGIAVSGPRKGEQLKNAMGFIGSWWAWEDFYTEFTFVE
jgi:hypothetical protein